ncbi:MAG: lipoyl(octanoyl) transferase LipB [Candidatus Sericytochromatia bacterium]
MSASVLEIHDLGLVPYPEVRELQMQWRQARARQEIPDRLILVEHPNVYTLGRKFQPESLGDPGDVPVLTVERGGDITFHEPGQLVAYPIFHLSDKRRDVGAFLRGLETVLINALAAWGLQGERDSRNTGVWIGGRKVASIGIAVSRWVTWHGLALNLNNDLRLAQAIRPCGFDPALLTSVQRERGQPVPMAEMKAELAAQFQHWWTP